MLFGLPACTETTPSRTVVLISMDTVSAPHMALYGGRARMPALEAFAGTAVVFDAAYSHLPETGPSHWSMLTGALPALHGNVAGQWDSAWTGPTLAERFAAGGRPAGAFIGGVTLQASSTGLQRGFSVYDDRVSPDPLDMKRPASEVTGAALAWMEQQRAPYFAFVHYFDAHAPYTPRDPRRYDPEYAGRYDGTVASIGRHREHGEPIDPRDLEHVRALYDAEITELDEALAPLLAAIPADAVVVITADHGESFGHDYLFNHRGALWDEVMHVPLIVRAPGWAPGRVAGQVGLVDVAPTVAARLGLPPVPCTGRDLGELVAGKASGAERIWMVTDPWGEAPLRALRAPPWKVIWDAAGAGRAFAIADDPGELAALAVPGALSGAQGDYEAELARCQAYVRERPQRADPSKEDRERLEALGYVAPGGVRPPHPPLPPPGAPGAGGGTPGTAGGPGPSGPPTGPPGAPDPARPPPEGGPPRPENPR